MPDLSAQILDLTNRLEAKQAEALRLAHQLAASLRVKSVWPEAFLNGQRCSRLVHTNGIETRTRKPKIIRRFLRRADGAEFDLTEKQYDYIVG